MPTKKETLAFIKENNVRVKAPTTMSVNALLAAVDKAVEMKDAPKSVATKWKRLKLVHDKSPQEKEEQNKKLKRQAFVKRGTASAKVPKRETMRKDSQRRPRMREAPIDIEIKNLMKMSNKIEKDKKAGGSY